MGCNSSCPYQTKKCSKIGFEYPNSTVFVLPRRFEPVMKPEKTTDYPLLNMTYEQKEILIKHYRATMLEQKPDIFHKTMLMCMQSSPKLNEIIACQMYCYRDLTKWPKLNHLCQAQLNFYDRLINVHKLDTYATSEAVYALGVIHYRYAQYGLKPHFLDMWQLSMERLAGKLKFADETEKTYFLETLRFLNNYVTSIMNLAYSRCQMQMVHAGKLFQDEKEDDPSAY